MEQVILLHRDFIHAGSLLHRDKLEAAVEAPFAGIVDREFYPTVTQKAVKLVDGISRAQAFQDGNKRLAWLCMTSFVELNGMVVCEPSEQAAAAWVINLDGSEDGLRQGVIWLNDRLDSLT
ncbi:MAG: Fic family protein [Phycicoccus sp.]|uniref:type II toxin-antitoxin system death-on-curing family toxin n=1 Tax=Phycicoccus sp. TaxID=1902410 RepID=UPI00258B787F|nr:Fic family protein [Phycicoccus sp.]MBK8730903.1 Fic family protein [Tetrasphaera sp.]MCO5303450.1 Fic family protein [Phycicoccus sp.]HPJ17915.1 Fic family protein [Actinomycetota bacterium]HPQ85106.1 Fic family protein [Actinomycetota bacterium]